MTFPDRGRSGDISVYTLDAFTEEEWRGRGIHVALLAHMLQAAREAGYTDAYTLASVLKRGSRKGVLRLMRPATAYQQAVDLDVLAAIDELSARLDEQRRVAAGERARLLAELRRLQALEREPDRDE